MLLAISVPVTAIILSVLTFLVMYLHCERKRRILKSLSTASAEPYETPVSVQATRFELKDNAAYGHINIHKPDAIYDTETPVSVQATRFELKDNAAYGHANYMHKPDAIYDTVNDK